MEPLKVALVGIGKLGSAMMTHWSKHGIKIGIFHPLKSRAEQFAEQFPTSYCLTEEELQEVDVLILVLPAINVLPFISNLDLEKGTPPSIINMATALDTKEIKAKFPSLNVLGVKYMGHSKDLMEHGNGLFITETPLPKHVEEIYHHLGQVKIDNESILSDVNKLATYLAVKAALEIENEFTKKGYPPEYVKRALTSLAPEVIRGYSEGTLGHFAMEIVKQVKDEA